MKRFLTGMILMPTGVYVIIAGNLPLYGLILIMGSIALYECHSMMKHPNHWYFLCALTGFIAWVSNIHFSHINGTQLICLGLISILFYAVSGIELLNKKLIGMNRPILLYVKSVIYVSTGFSALIFLTPFLIPLTISFKGTPQVCLIDPPNLLIFSCSS